MLEPVMFELQIPRLVIRKRALVFSKVVVSAKAWYFRLVLRENQQPSSKAQ
jgi:hypothetical protein